MSILFAVCCLLFSALNDFVFKLLTRKERSRGMFITIIGCVWLATLVWLPWTSTSDFRATLLWGTISGVFSLMANILLIEAMERQSAGICSTIYRMNMVLVVAVACLYLNEPMMPLQFSGIVLAVLAILAFVPSGDKTKLQTVGFWLVIGAAVLRAGMGLSYKYGFLQGADVNGVVVINSLFWIGGGLLYAWYKEKSIRLPDFKLLSYGALSGVLVSGIVFFMAAALRYGNASVVLPIAQMSFLGTFVLSIVFLRERINSRKLVALICGTATIILLSL